MAANFLLPLALFLCASTAQAQLGLQIGYNSSTCRMNNYKQTLAPSRISGITMGAFYRSQGRYILVQPTLAFTQKGTRDSSLINRSPWKYEYRHTRLNYFQFSMPVLLQLRVPKTALSFEAGLGPYAAWLTHARSVGKEYIAGGKAIEDYSIGNSNTDDFKKWDGGISFIAGISYHRLAVSASYDWGMTNVTPKLQQTIQNRNLGINLILLLD